MWLSLLFFVGIIFVVLGGLVLGGIFTIVLLPLAVIAAVTAVAFALWARATRARSTTEKPAADNQPLPQSEHSNVAPRPSTPDELVDARQQAP